MAEPIAPLTKENLADIERALTDLETAEETIRRAKQAGIDVEDQEQRARMAREKLTRIRQAFTRPS